MTHHSLSHVNQQIFTVTRDFVTVDLQVNIAPALSRQDFKLKMGSFLTQLAVERLDIDFSKAFAGTHHAGGIDGFIRTYKDKTLSLEFDGKIGISGVVLTRMDGDGRGGAALSMRAVTGKPIRFVGLGEKMDAIETFEPDRIAGRILGMGDIVALVEKAQETIEAAERVTRSVSPSRARMIDL